MKINIFAVINQINKHKAKIYNKCRYTPIIIKTFHNYIKKISPDKYNFFFCLLNIRMINLSFDELRLLAQIRNISHYENKSKEDLIKVLSETKPKPETPKQEPEPKPEIRVNKGKLKRIRKDFDELRHKSFLKKK